MTDQHPITPPPELLVQQWLGEYFGCDVKGEVSIPELHLATRAAQWGADQELEACCSIALTDRVCGTAQQRKVLVRNLRAARRPKPPSLKEQALEALERMHDACLMTWDNDTIRRALEALPE